ncbi:MAG: hypothetical protein ACPHJ3_10585, partial [Rubripirellula sp.]
MQTLKTAAIVVLMMAVIYGAYVSMTKPPEPLPEDVQGLLAVDEGLDIPFDSSLGLPESLGGNSGSSVSPDTPLVDSGSLQVPDSQLLGSSTASDITSNAFTPGLASGAETRGQPGSPVP